MYLQFTATKDGAYEVVFTSVEGEVGDYEIRLGESDASLIA